MVGEDGVRSVGRAIELIALFDESHPFPTLADLVERSGLPKTTVVRLLGSLERDALIADRSDGRYTLAAGFLRWVRLADELWDVNRTTRRVMLTLVDEIGETVNIYIRQGVNRVSIAQEQGRHTVRNVVERGRPFPLSGGAAATVLIAGTPAILQKVASSGRVDAAVLKARVAEFESQGFVVSEGEREPGASAVSAAIRDSGGRIIAALSISGPSSRFDADLIRRSVAAVTAGAGEITRRGMGAVEALL